MLYLYVNNALRNSDLENNTVRIKNQIQQRADSANFTLLSGTKPSENEDVGIFLGDTIAGFSGTTVTLDGHFQTEVGFFYTGQKLHIRIGDADEEEVEVLTYDEAALQIVLVAAPSGSVSVGDKIGEIVFGGVVSRMATRNVVYKDNVEYDVEAVSYDKIFDKKLISDTWADVDSRYVINSFVNSTVNYNQTVDNLDYADNTAIQAEWIESGTGSNPTISSGDFMEGDASAVFTWTGSGTAIFSGTPTAVDLSDLVGVASGTPTEGSLMIWRNPADYTAISSFKIRIGSDSSNYAELTFTVPTSNDWAYASVKFANATITGTPNWTAVDYLQVRIAHTAGSSIKLNGIRVNSEGSFTLYNVQAAPTIFDDLRAPRLKPTAFMQTLAKTFEYLWYIDYDRDIHYMPQETEYAPFSLTDTSNNFDGLKVEVDQSQIGNRIIILGGEEISDSRYSQVVPGDNAVREWVLKAKFSSLEVLLDDNTDTNTALARTTTTNIKITAHGLTTGDHITNRTRSNAVREVTVVDADNVTVEAVPSQTTGDTITFYTTAVTLGIEGIDDEATVDYVYNSNERTVRASTQTVTLPTTTFIRFEYNERVPIQLQYTDFASVAALKALGLGDGVFDLDPITDESIEDRATAIVIAQGKIAEFSNPIITGNFTTEQRGLKAGQLLHVEDTAQSVNDDFVIQTVSLKQREGRYFDNVLASVTFGTTLFGWIEFMQKLLSLQGKISVNEDAVVATFVTANEVVESSDVNAVATDGGFKTATVSETVESSDVNVVVDFPSGTWRWEPNGVGQPLDTRWNLFDWG